MKKEELEVKYGKKLIEKIIKEGLVFRLSFFLL
jgi:hypothetical protein